LQVASSPTPHHQRPPARFTPSQTGFAGSGDAGRDFHRTSLTCPQIKRRSTHRPGPAPAQCTELSPKRRGQGPETQCCLRCGANRPAALNNGMSWQQLIASNAPSDPRAPRGGTPVPMRRCWRSASVGRANAEPAVADLMVMHTGIVDRGRKLEHHRRQPSDLVEHRV
jgi:hypothetical protein